MTVVPALALTRLHQLAWQPGAWMTEQWWEKLGLAEWRPYYFFSPAYRSVIDELIVKRRSFPLRPLPATLSGQEQRLLSIEQRLPSLVTAMGLVVLGRKHFLMIGEYRRLLSPIIGEKACDQLLMLWPVDTHSTEINPVQEIAADDLANYALRCGTCWLNRQSSSPVWQALSILLPPVDEESLPMPGLSMAFFFRMARFI